MTDVPRSRAAVSGRSQIRRFGPWIFFAALLVVAPLVFNTTFGVSLLNQMGIVIVFALSYNMLLGQGGMLSFGHAVYMGLGGFMTAHALNFIGDGLIDVPLPVVPLFGGLFGLIFGILFGSFSTRRAGTIFAMISLGIGELVAGLSLIFVFFFGGEEGISANRTDPMRFFGLNFGQDIQVYYLIAFWVFVATAAMYFFSRTPAGRMANAVRDNPERAEFVGYSQRIVRFISFSGAGFFAGIAGGLFAVNYEIVTEENLNLITSGVALLMAYIGGIGFFIGPIIGAITFTLLQSVLGAYTEIWQLYVGILFLATVVFMPWGLTGILMIHMPAVQRGSLGRLAGPYALAAAPAIAALLGIAGLLEMIHHLNTAPADEPEMGLFFMTVNTASVLPWLILVVLAVGGVLALRKLAPAIHDAWSDASGYRRGGPK
ncbi:branched-chain amino acid ABC transporter permease [Marinibaculum pumilum]|uniref:Branched-chain amino acid ABC transporter permease n=1 Tax=Marinibaculum pumilum TaxID=1766165 RepID=A0ABV7L6C2_9PROT